MKNTLPQTTKLPLYRGLKQSFPEKEMVLVNVSREFSMSFQNERNSSRYYLCLKQFIETADCLYLTTRDNLRMSTIQIMLVLTHKTKQILHSHWWQFDCGIIFVFAQNSQNTTSPQKNKVWVGEWIKQKQGFHPGEFVSAHQLWVISIYVMYLASVMCNTM